KALTLPFKIPNGAPVTVTVTVMMSLNRTHYTGATDLRHHRLQVLTLSPGAATWGMMALLNRRSIMDLQWQRQTELWLRLIGATGHPPALSLSLKRGRDTLYLEQCQGRARVSLARPLPEQELQPTLLRLLALLQPDAGAGTPLRAWLTGTALWISAMAPPECGAEQWAALVQRQRLLLDRVTIDAHQTER
ncbi:hypothetical protein, partial [Aeromonas jandaei]